MGLSLYTVVPSLNAIGLLLYAVVPSLYAVGLLLYAVVPSSYDKPTTHNKYYHIRQLWRSITYPTLNIAY